MAEKVTKPAPASGGRSGNKPKNLSDITYLSGVKRTDIMAHLGARDKKMAALIERAGPLALTVDEMQSSYQALAESIVFQQITGKAARAICQKIYSAYDTDSFPEPAKLVGASSEKLRALGLSSNKAAAIKDLAQRTLGGLVPTVEEMHNLEDEDLFERLTAVRGIGPWTVHMLQIFRLGRLDVMPASDFGVRKGFANIYFAKAKLKLDPKALPAPLEVIKQAEKWRPYRSAAAWYLWRAAEGK